MNSKIGERLAHFTVTLAIAVIVIGGLAFVRPNFMRGRALREEAAELDAQIARERQQIAKLADNQLRFKTDPDFVEAIARQNRRLYAGELLFIFDAK